MCFQWCANPHTLHSLSHVTPVAQYKHAWCHQAATSSQIAAMTLLLTYYNPHHHHIHHLAPRATVPASTTTRTAPPHHPPPAVQTANLRSQLGSMEVDMNRYKAKA